MAEVERVLAELEGPCSEVRLDVLEQLGWLAGRHGRVRVSYRAYRERYERLVEAVGPEDPVTVEARERAVAAAERAGFRRRAVELASPTPA